MMKVVLNPVSFRSTENKTVHKGMVDLQNLAPEAGNQVQSLAQDSIQIDGQNNNNASEKKKGRGINEGIANVWKFFSVTNQMANSALKGILYGAVTGVAFLGGSWLFATMPKAFSKGGPKLWEVVRHPLKNMPKSGKIISGIASAAVLAYQLVAGKLQANQKTAVIDHKLKVGHRDV